MDDFFANPWSITILGGVIVTLIAYYLFGVGRNNDQSGLGMDTMPRLTKPSPLEIMNDVRSTPLYQQNETGNIYEGNKVTWKLQLVDISNDKEISRVSTVEILAAGDDTKVAAVIFEVKASQHPELKVMAKFDQIYVEGIIKNVSSSGIHLENCKLQFLH